MNLITALAIVIGILGAAATYLCLGVPAVKGLQIWALFIAWGSFFHCGGGESGLKNSLIANLWGIIVASVALFLVGKVGGGVIGASAVVGITVAVMILGAHLPILGAIPAAVYGYASTAAFGLLASGDPTSFVLGTGTIPTIGASMIAGALFGYVSGKIAGALAK